MKNIREISASPEKLIAAHRGASAIAPENTLSAILAALDAGANIIEIDVQTSKDGSVMVFHDEELDRTTDGSGFIAELDYDRLRRLDAGAYFDEKFKGEKIPSLAEAVDLIRDKAYLAIEIKDSDDGRGDEKIRNALEVLRREDYLYKTLFASFNHDLLVKIKSEDASLATAAVKLPCDARLPSEIRAATLCDAFICSIDEISPEIDADAKSSGVFIGVYSIDNEKDFERVSQYEIKAYGSNNPLKLVEILKNANLI